MKEADNPYAPPLSDPDSKKTTAPLESARFSVGPQNDNSWSAEFGPAGIQVSRGPSESEQYTESQFAEEAEFQFRYRSAAQIKLKNPSRLSIEVAKEELPNLRRWSAAHDDRPVYAGLQKQRFVNLIYSIVVALFVLSRSSQWPYLAIAALMLIQAVPGFMKPMPLLFPLRAIAFSLAVITLGYVLIATNPAIGAISAVFGTASTMQFVKAYQFLQSPVPSSFR